MEHITDNGLPQKQPGACVVVGVFQSRRLSAAAEAIDQAADGVLTHVCERGDMDGRVGQTLLLHDLPNVTAERVLQVGCRR
jgi:leucyl aminopeptidase